MLEQAFETDRLAFAICASLFRSAPAPLGGVTPTNTPSTCSWTLLIAAQTRSAAAPPFDTSSTSASGIDTATLDPTPKFATASRTSRAPYVSSLTRATPSPLRRLNVAGRLVTPSLGRRTTPRFGMGFFWRVQPVAVHA